VFWDNGKLHPVGNSWRFFLSKKGSQVVVQDQILVLADGKSQVVTLTTPDGVIGVYKELADKPVEGKRSGTGPFTTKNNPLGPILTLTRIK